MTDMTLFVRYAAIVTHPSSLIALFLVQVHRAVEGWPSRNTPHTGHTRYIVVPHSLYSINCMVLIVKLSFTRTANERNISWPWHKSHFGRTGWLPAQVSTWCCTGVFSVIDSGQHLTRTIIKLLKYIFFFLATSGENCFVTCMNWKRHSKTQIR